MGINDSPVQLDLSHAETHPSDMCFVVTTGGDKIERTNLRGVASTFSELNDRTSELYQTGMVPQVYWNLAGSLVELHVAVGTGERALVGTENRFTNRDTTGLHVVELRLPQGDMVRHRYTGATKIFTHFYL